MEKTVFITGANKGIGFGIAKHLGLCGWKVIIGARNEQRAERAIDELKSQGIDVLGWVHIELKDLDGIDKAAKEIAERYPELSLLVNNAGIPGDMSVDSQHTEINVIQETLDVNFVGTFALTKALIPLLSKNCGRIAFGNQSLLASVSLRCQQGSPECHDGCDGHRVSAVGHSFGNLLRSSRSDNNRPQRKHVSSRFSRH